MRDEGMHINFCLLPFQQVFFLLDLGYALCSSVGFLSCLRCYVYVYSTSMQKNTHKRRSVDKIRENIFKITLQLTHVLHSKASEMCVKAH